jgi:protein-tyrosine phosphatase
VETEGELAARLGMRYKRIPLTDRSAPADENIDDFVAFYKSLPANAWLHFHCHAGHGRTTTFAVFYDILSNPDVALEDIVARQYALGGANLFASSKKDNWKGREMRKRAQQIRKFYAYVQAGNTEEGRAEAYDAGSQYNRLCRGVLQTGEGYANR